MSAPPLSPDEYRIIRGCLSDILDACPGARLEAKVTSADGKCLEIAVTVTPPPDLDGIQITVGFAQPTPKEAP